MKKISLLLVIFLLGSALWAQNRYALVIGNANYTNDEDKLPNAINDTNDIKKALEGLGYQVTLKHDLKRKEMVKAISTFIKQLDNNRNSEGFFWYAGHAMEIGGENLLLPVNVKNLETEEDDIIKASSYPISELTTRLEKVRNKINVVVLDACRVPPSYGGRSFGDASRVIKTITLKASDLLIIYSTTSGTVALDGKGERNSPFAKAFLKHITSTEPIPIMMTHVTTETLSLTGQKQRPSFNGSMGSENAYYSLNPGAEPSSRPLTVWSFTDELGGIVNNYYSKDNPTVKIEYSETPTVQFPDKLDPVLSSGQGAPDIFALESAFVRKYVESGFLLDITDIYNANKSKLLAYPTEVGTYNGKVYAMSWQACPGAMFYRRSLAKKYLGTDDPKVVQTYFTNSQKFLETAQLLKNKSNNLCVVVSSLGDLQFPFLGLRKSPWIVNNKLVIDPAMDQYLDMVKTMDDNVLHGYVGQWSEGWFAGMNDNLVWSSSGKKVEVFSYFLPTWGLHYVLKNNAPDTAGDWAMIQGPCAWRWGGTWIAAYKGTKKVKEAKDFITYVTTSDAFLEKYALGTGDMVSNLAVVNKIKTTYREPFLGGQNHYAELAEMAKTINGKLAQSTDDYIQGLFAEAIAAYVSGEKSKAQALADFRSQVETGLKLSK